MRLEDVRLRRSAVELAIPGCAESDRGHLLSVGFEWLLVALRAFPRWRVPGGQPRRAQWSWILENKCPSAEGPSKKPIAQRSSSPELPSSRCHSPGPGLRCPSRRSFSPSPASAGAARRSSRSTCCHPSRWPA